MKQILKRLFSFAMAALMVLSLVPFNGLEVYAAENETDLTISTVEELKSALTEGGEILVGADITVDEALTIPENVTLTVNEGRTLRVLNTLTNNGIINGEGKIAVSVMVYVTEETENYNVTATKNGAISGTAPECAVAYEISLDSGENWIADTTNGKAQAVLVKTDGTATVYASFQSAFTTAKTGETVHMLTDAHVQSTNAKKNNGPLRSYYGLILEGNGHAIYTDLESSGASNEYATIKFTSYLAGTGPQVNPVLKNVTIDSQNNAKADLDFVSGDVTFTVTMYNVNLLGKCQYASLPIKSSSMIVNKSNVSIYDCTIPSWDAGSANQINLYSGAYSLSLNNKCTVYGGTYTKDVSKYVAEGCELVKNADSTYIVAANPAYGMVAQIGNNYYATLEAAFAAAVEGDTIVLLADAAPVLTSQRAITKAAVIDLNGKTLTLTEDDLYFGTTTFENGNIVVAPSVEPSTAVFWMFEDQALTFDAVKLTATGVTGTYLIGLDGNNADLNLLNGSEIYINNETALDLDVICVNASTGNDIVIDNSKVTVNNLDGRVFFRGNYTVRGNSDIDLSGITKAGFRIEAGQTLTIQDTATVDIAGEPRDGGIHLTDATAVYTKADTATVNATVNAPVVEPAGTITYGFTSQTGIWGETTNNASESMVVELYYGETKIASTELNNIGGIIDGDVYVTWSIPFAGSTDEYWTVQWAEGYPSVDAQPTKIVLVVDGTAVAENAVQMNGPDNLNPVVWKDLEIFKQGLSGEGTEADPFLIENLEDLIWFRDDVNAGNTYAGKFVKLTADIDLNQVAWTSIRQFNGTFDGDNHIISNLQVAGSGNVGFFAQVADQTEKVSGTVKNVTFQNATITSSNGEAALIASARLGARISNVKLTGEVAIQGYRGVGGIVGAGFPVMDGCSVEATGTITATYWGAGGILGFASDAGAKVTNSTIIGTPEVLTIHGELGGVGAVTGTPHGAKTNGAVIRNVNLTSNNNYYMAYADASGKASNVTVENAKVLVNGQEIIGNDAVASVDGSIYFNLQAALDAAVAGTGEITVEILRDVDLTNVDWNPVTVSGPGYPLVTVNGNNKTITGLNDMLFAGTWAGESGLIINDLTIKDSTIVNDKDDTKGTVGVGAFIGYPQASATITLNNCHLVDSSVEGGHWTGGLIGMAGGYNGNDGPVFMNLTITDCSVTGSTITGKGSVGGVIGHGSCAAWTNVVIADTDVSGNTITSTGSSTNKAGSVMGTIGAAGQPTTAAGETKTGGAFVSATTSNNTVTSGGTTITTIYGRQGTNTGLLTVTGGTYEAYPIEENVSYAAPEAGYKIVQNDDGNYVLKECEYVAEVDGTKFEFLQVALDAVKDEENIVINLLDDVALDITAWQTLAIGGETTKTITINGNGKTLTFNKLNSDWNHVTTNNNAKLILNNMTITDSGKNNGPWNRYDLNFACDVELNNVTSTKALAFKADAVLNAVTVNETGDNYAIWIQANGQSVTIDGLTVNSAGRGIKIDNQYVDEATKVTLSVENATFTTAKKAAILVKNPAGADITVSNVDISNVAADAENVVWNDEDNVAYFNMITVTGGTKAQEGDFPIVVKDAKGNIFGYYKSLQTAIEAADGKVITLVDNIELTAGVTVPVGKTITLDLNGKTITGKPAEPKAFSVIENKGNLTITGNGSIVCDHQLTGSTGYAVNTITNGGTLTVSSATIENKSTASNQIGYAIDNNSTTGDAILVIKDGEVRASGSNYYDGIRLFCNSLTKENSVSVEGGTVSSIWLQNPSDGTAEKDAKDVKGSVSITGGKVNALYLEPSAAFAAEITDGYVGKVEYFTTSEGRDLTGFITGGTFGMDVTEYCAPGYKAEANGDNTYSVVVNEKIVAWNMQTGKEYETVAAALLAAKENETVQLLADSDESMAVLTVLNGITLDLDGHTLTAYYAMTATTGSYIIDSTNGQGLLKVTKNNLVMADNTQLKIWMEEENGYRFAATSFTTKLETPAKGSATFRFYLNETYGLVMKELANGSADNDGLSMQVKMTYTNSQGGSSTLYFDFPAEKVAEYAAKEYSGKASHLFMTIIGLDAVSDVSFAAVIKGGSIMIEGTAVPYNG